MLVPFENTWVREQLTTQVEVWSSVLDLGDDAEPGIACGLLGSIDILCRLIAQIEGLRPGLMFVHSAPNLVWNDGTPVNGIPGRWGLHVPGIKPIHEGIRLYGREAWTGPGLPVEAVPDLGTPADMLPYGAAETILCHLLVTHNLGEFHAP